MTLSTVIGELSKMSGGTSELEILAILHEQGPSPARKIKHFFYDPERRSSNSVTASLKALMSKGHVQAVRPNKWDWPVYSLTPHASGIFNKITPHLKQ